MNVRFFTHSFLLVLLLTILFGGCAEQDRTGASDQIRGIRNGTTDSGSDPSFPDVLALLENGQFHCTAVALSPRLLITAGHCVAQFRRTPSVYSVQVGLLNVPVKEVFVHPNYNFGGAVGTVDLAMVELKDYGLEGFSGVAGFNGREFRRVYGGGSFSRGSSFVAVGLGDNGGGSSGVRRYGEVVFTEYQASRGRDGLGYPQGLLELVPDPETQSITCLGDSGGPAILGDQLVGFSSFVSFSGAAYSCNAVHSAHFTDARSFGEWIDTVRRAEDPDSDCRFEGGFRSEDGGCKSVATGKVWSGQARRSFSWDEAMSYCGNAVEAGLSDWRLATREELEYLVREGGVPYLGVEVGLFWSSSVVNASAVHGVDLQSGAASTRSKSETLSVLCVRG